MAAHGLVRQIDQEGGLADKRVTLIGEESQLAYDRVNLSKSVDASELSLALATADWYDERRILFHRGRRIVSIDRVNRVVLDGDGVVTPYDDLVLATGSHPFVPPIPGADAPGVLVYRTIDDLRMIRDRCQADGVQTGAVIGGGLLGLEAAKIMRDAGLRVCVIERAAGLMPRQLDDAAARLLRRRVEEMGVEVLTVRRTSSIEKVRAPGRDQTKIHFENSSPLAVDVLIIAAGVKPNDQLAKDAGLKIGARGGIAVDRTMATSDPRIFAIGECVSFGDQLFGLVAPCYRMADVLASRLCGGNDYFEGGDSSAELKLLGVNVATLGQTLDEVPGALVLRYDGEDAYRRLILDQGRLVGATCVGSWEQLPQIRLAIDRGQTLWPWQRSRFRSTGSPWPGDPMPVSHWPSSAIVCSCHRVSRGRLSEVIESLRQRDHLSNDVVDNSDEIVAEICLQTSASTACGSCRNLVCELAGMSSKDDRSVATKVVTFASLAGIAFLLAVITLPPVELAESVQSSWRKIDVLWRSDFARQVTGYTTVGLTLFGLTLSLRKRFSRFTIGSHAFWRAIHSAIGAAVIVALAVHTGLRMGQNLNFVLSSTFLAVAALGTTIGIAAALERRTAGTTSMWLRRWRPRLTTIHNVLFWPLPALVIVHVFSFYWYSS